jgi:hypothetical protein
MQKRIEILHTDDVPGDICLAFNKYFASTPAFKSLCVTKVGEMTGSSCCSLCVQTLTISDNTAGQSCDVTVKLNMVGVDTGVKGIYFLETNDLTEFLSTIKGSL